jgi:hypothetical protein
MVVDMPIVAEGDVVGVENVVKVEGERVVEKLLVPNCEIVKEEGA